jgi:hypothetical protein
MTAPATDRAERRLLTDRPLPGNSYVIKVGASPQAPAYIIGLRRDPVVSPRHEEPFSYIVHLAHEMVDVYHPVKVIAASGTPKEIVWTNVQTIHSNIIYDASPNNRLLDATVFPLFTLSMSADCQADTEDELRTANYVYVIKDLYPVNELITAICTRRKARA